jgi:hypothetical protein
MALSSICPPTTAGAVALHAATRWPAQPAPARQAVQPHRLFGRARGGRPARRHRPLAAMRGRLGRDHRLPPRLWSLGLGVAEAMDTAQRGMGLDWPTSLELIRRARGRSARRARRISGLRLRHRPPGARERTLDDVIRAYEEQMEAIEKLGGKLIVMASRALAACHAARRLRTRVRPHPVAGQAAGGPALAGRHVRPGAGAGYWGSADTDAAMDTALGVIAAHAPRSTASRSRCWTRTRRSRCAAACPPGVRMYTGDDFNYAELIAGDGVGGPPTAERCAAGHLRRHRAGRQRGAGRAGAGDEAQRFHAILGPTVPLSRHIFKRAHALLQDRRGVHGLAQRPPGHFTMVGGQQSTRSLPHLCRAVPPGRRGRGAATARTGGAPHENFAGPARRRMSHA